MWNIELEIGGDKLFDILLNFFHDKTKRLLHENMLLTSRWGRFCTVLLMTGRNSFDIAKFTPIFKGQQNILKLEYTDAVDRYERLFEVKSTIDEKAKSILVCYLC